MFSLNFWNLPALSRTWRTQPFNYNSCVTKFKTKLQKVTRTIMKPKVPCIMLSFYQAACHLIIARSQSFCTTLLPGTLVHFVVGTAQSVSWLSFLLWVMDSSPEPGTSSFFLSVWGRGRGHAKGIGGVFAWFSPGNWVYCYMFYANKGTKEMKIK